MSGSPTRLSGRLAPRRPLGRRTRPNGQTTLRGRRVRREPRNTCDRGRARGGRIRSDVGEQFWASFGEGAMRMTETESPAPTRPVYTDIGTALGTDYFVLRGDLTASELDYLDRARRFVHD